MEDETYVPDRELAVKAQEQVSYVTFERGQVANLVDAYRTIAAHGPDMVPGHQEDLGILAGLLMMSVGTGVKLVPEEGPANVRVAVPRLLVDAIKDANQQAANLADYKEKHQDGKVGPIDAKSMEVLEAQQATHRAALKVVLANVIITDLAGVADAYHY